jgi:hypothetical protein
VDNFAQPPSQDPDMMMQLTNIMPITNGTIQRRWGYTLWDSPSSVPTNQMYSYQSDVTQKREIILTAAQAVFAQNEDGSNYDANIFVPSLTPRAVISRSYAHFASGAAADRQTWNGIAGAGTQNWGIDINNVAGLINGPNAPGTATDLGGGGATGSAGPNSPSTAINLGSGINHWLNPTNVFAADSVYSTNPVPTLQGSDELQVKGFGFAIPGTATITGVVIKILRKGTVGVTTGITDNGVFLMKAGIRVGSNHGNSFTVWTTTATTATYGSSSDLWGTTLTPADINSAGFGGTLSVSNFDGATQTASVDYYSITVYYTTPVVGTWSAPNNIKVQDSIVATSLVTTSATSILQATNFGFAVPVGNRVIGIQVDILCDSPDDTPTLKPTLVKGGVAFGATKQTQLVRSSTLAFVTFGGPTDLWGAQWAAADTNAANFGVQFFAITGAGTATLNVDFVRITVYTAVGPVTAAIGAAGQINLLQGRIYFVVFQNSLKPITSDLNFPSLITGAVTNQMINISNIPVCLDPQCDTKLLLATADGGNEERLFLVTTLANATTTYVDNTPDVVTATTTLPALLNQSVYLSTDDTGQEFGVAGNNRPPIVATFPIAHRGNIYLANATTLFWSKSLADVTTDTNTVTTRWEEAWPAQNQLDVSGQAEHIAGMLSDGVNLYIGTEKKIRRVNGSAPFLEPPDIVHNEVGIVNQNVWQIVFNEGSPIGAMWLTPDNRIIGSDFNTYTDIGTSVQTTLNSINRNAIQVSHASFYSNGPFDLYILAIPTGTSTQCDTQLIYNIRTQRWNIWQLTDQLVALLFNIRADGTPQLLLATAAGAIYYIDSTVFQDRVGNTPVSFQATMQTSWLDLGDPALRKLLNEIEITTTSSTTLVTVEGASTSNEFLTPRNVIGTAPIVLSPRGEYKVYLAGSPSVSRYYRFTFTTSDIAQFLLGSINVELVPVNRQ